MNVMSIKNVLFFMVIVPFSKEFLAIQVAYLMTQSAEDCVIRDAT